MHDYRIACPSGGFVTVQYDSFADAMKIVHEQLKRESANITSGWLTTSALSKNKFNIENRVKFFLDSLGYLMLQAAHLANQNNGITSLYKEKAKRERELPHDFQGGDPARSFNDSSAETDGSFSRVPPYPPAVSSSSPSPRKSPMTRSDKIREIKQQYGRDCDVRFERIDTDSKFSDHGYLYWLDDDIAPQYKPKTVKDDVLYDMDAVAVVESKDGSIGFFDLKFDRIPDDAIQRIG